MIGLFPKQLKLADTMALRSGGDNVKYHHRCVFVGYLLALNVSGLSETRPLSMWIGGQEIRLGSPVMQVTSALSAKNFTIQAESADPKLPLRAWWVFGPPEGEWASTFAVIYTQSNNIVGIENRTSTAESVQDAFNALFGGASKVSEQDRNRCTIQPSSQYLKNGTLAFPLGKSKTFIRGEF